MASRKTTAIALSAGALCLAHGPAAASGPTLSGNIEITSNYIIRGISQTSSMPAAQGGVDVDWAGFYAGAWASNIDFRELGLKANTEIDVYGGWRPRVGKVDLNLGYIYYTYPGAHEGAIGVGDMNYSEAYVKAGLSPAKGFSLQSSFAYSPQGTLHTGHSWYAEGLTSYAVSPELTLSAAIGHQKIGDVTGVLDSLVAPFTAKREAEYTTWNAGGTFSAFDLEFDVRWYDTDIGANHPIIQEAYATEKSVEGTLVFLIRKAF